MVGEGTGGGDGGAGEEEERKGREQRKTLLRGRWTTNLSADLFASSFSLRIASSSSERARARRPVREKYPAEYRDADGVSMCRESHRVSCARARERNRYRVLFAPVSARWTKPGRRVASRVVFPARETPSFRACRLRFCSSVIADTICFVVIPLSSSRANLLDTRSKTSRLTRPTGGGREQSLAKFEPRSLIGSITRRFAFTSARRRWPHRLLSPSLPLRSLFRPRHVRASAYIRPGGVVKGAVRAGGRHLARPPGGAAGKFSSHVEFQMPRTNILPKCAIALTRVVSRDTRYRSPRRAGKTGGRLRADRVSCPRPAPLYDPGKHLS